MTELFGGDLFVSRSMRHPVAVTCRFEALVTPPPIGMNQAAFLHAVDDKRQQIRARGTRDMAHSDPPHSATLQLYRNHHQRLPDEFSPADMLFFATHVSLVDFKCSAELLGVPAAPSPGAAFGASARRSCSCPGRVRAAGLWHSAPFSEYRPATSLRTNSSAAPASCAGSFPPLERSAGDRSCNTRSRGLLSSPWWPNNGDKRNPAASGRRADTHNRPARW